MGHGGQRRSALLLARQRAQHLVRHPSGRGARRGNYEAGPKKIVAYASMIKANDPSALVLGPEEWGWSGYFYSGYDQQYGAAHGWNNLPDRAAHGNMDYLPWILAQLRQN